MQGVDPNLPLQLTHSATSSSSGKRDDGQEPSYPLLLAVDMELVCAVQKLLENGANPNVFNNSVRLYSGVILYKIP